MTRHLHPREHLPHPHIAEHIAAAFQHALEAVRGEHWHPPAERTVPAAEDWPDWHWPEGSDW
ncbi:hypothetical protein [Nocardia wallacei]|uniref:hypothetical protein n=1 Tax=Nocardia wallacei TaxID=480035 RepID=UPI00245522B1|nr:hypothetical protein [Nocardia wallacei]